MSQYQARTYAVKVVPDAEPNHDGLWIKVVCRSLSGIRRFSDAAHILEATATGMLPGHHVVQYEETDE